MRLFVALELPAAVRGTLHAWAVAGLSDAHWRPVPEGNLHVTLAFLGERPEADRSAAGAVVVRCAGAAAPVLRCAGAVALPPRRPRLLAVRLEETGEALVSLQARVAGELARAGMYERDRRPFLAHVTAARARRGRGGREDRDGREGRGGGRCRPSPPLCAFEPPSVTLFASLPAASGVRYEPLTSAPLKPRDHRT